MQRRVKEFKPDALKNGEPATAVGPPQPRARTARGILKDELFVIGDIMSPIDVEWDALK